MEQTDLRYLKSLAKQYPTVAAAATEIINLQAILSLPKGTEHFITDIHGEYDQFQHVLKNGSADFYNCNMHIIGCEITVKTALDLVGNMRDYRSEEHTV